jgi:hypothetical protein
MWAKKDAINVPTYACERMLEFGMDLVEIFHREKTSTNPRLIAGDDNADPGMIETRYRFETAWNRYPLFGRFNVFVGVFIDDPIAVQDDQFGQLAHISMIRRMPEMLLISN